MNPVLLWVRSLRPYSFTASIMPVVVSSAYVRVMRGTSFLKITVVVLSVLLMHMGVNVLNDHADYVHKVDSFHSKGASLLIQKGLISEKSMFYSGHIYLFIAIILGLILSGGDLNIVLFGMICFVFSYFYTSTIFSFKYSGLGEVMVFFLLGPCVFIWTELVLANTVSSVNLMLSVPVGLLVTNIMLGNNIRDIEVDRKGGITTLPIFIGRKWSVRSYVFIVFLSYIIFIRSVTVFEHAYYILLTIPFAVYNCRLVLRSAHNRSVIDYIDKKSALFHFVFCFTAIVIILLNGRGEVL
ncbi:MAG: prenyltransferase [Candidatus Muiribacteriaceae bacterium]